MLRLMHQIGMKLKKHENLSRGPDIRGTRAAYVLLWSELGPVPVPGPRLRPGQERDHARLSFLERTDTMGHTRSGGNSKVCADVFAWSMC